MATHDDDADEITGAALFAPGSPRAGTTYASLLHAHFNGTDVPNINTAHPHPPPHSIRTQAIDAIANDRFSNYDSLLLAQLSTLHGSPAGPARIQIIPSLPLDKDYLLCLKASTQKIWPSIRGGGVAEREYYRNLHFERHAGEVLSENRLFGELSLIYGPLVDEKSVAAKLSEEAWVEGYQAKASRPRFEGSHEVLLKGIAQAYAQTKTDLLKADQAEKERAEAHALALAAEEAAQKKIANAKQTVNSEQGS